MVKFNFDDYYEYMKKASNAYFAYKDFCKFFDVVEMLKDVFGDKNIFVDDDLNIMLSVNDIGNKEKKCN